MPNKKFVQTVPPKNAKADSTLLHVKPALTFNLRRHPFGPTSSDFIKNLLSQSPNVNLMHNLQRYFCFSYRDFSQSY